MLLNKFYDRLTKSDPIVFGRREIAELIEKSVYGDPSLADFAWDDFMNAKLVDPYERLIQRLAYLIEDHFPGDNKNQWCNEKGLKALLRIAEAIRSNSLPFPPTEKEIIEFDKDQIPTRYRNFLL